MAISLMPKVSEYLSLIMTLVMSLPLVMVKPMSFHTCFMSLPALT
mgnify:CR=1 FL=1